MSAEPLTHSWPDLLDALLDGRSLTARDTEWAMDDVMSGRAGPVRLAGLMVALRAKGETVEEIEGLVRALYRHAVRLEVPGPALDIVGTGGDGSNSVNISTMSAIVAMRRRCPRRQARQPVGVLGLRLGRRPGGAGRRAGAGTGGDRGGRRGRRHHLLLRSGVPPGAAARGRSAPRAGHPYGLQRAGSAGESGRAGRLRGGRRRPAARPAARRGAGAAGVSALVFRGDDGMDELTVTTTSTVWSVHGGEVREERFDPRALGIPGRTRPRCAAATGCTTRGWRARSSPTPGGRYGTRCCCRRRRGSPPSNRPRVPAPSACRRPCSARPSPSTRARPSPSSTAGARSPRSGRREAEAPSGPGLGGPGPDGPVEWSRVRWSGRGR